MKTLTFLFLALCSLQGYAQDYIPLVKPGATWTYSISDAEEPFIRPCEKFEHIQIMYITSDTIVYNNNIYFKLNNFGRTGIREDSLKRVYTLDLDEWSGCSYSLPKENLLFDFSLLNDSNTVTIDGVTRRYYVDRTNDYGKIVEGIGAIQSSGLLNQCNGGLRTWFDFLCFQDDSIKYVSPIAKECGLCPDYSNDTCNLQTDFEVIEETCGCNYGILKVNVTNGSPPYTYLWNDMNESKDNIAFNLSPGTYTVSIWDSVGCLTSDTMQLSWSCKGEPCGVDDISRKMVSIYPNPIYTKSTLNLGQSSDFNFSLFNFEGQLLISRELKKTNTMELDRGNLKSGIYFYRILFEDGNMSQGKLMVR